MRITGVPVGSGRLLLRQRLVVSELLGSQGSVDRGCRDSPNVGRTRQAAGDCIVCAGVLSYLAMGVRQSLTVRDIIRVVEYG